MNKLIALGEALIDFIPLNKEDSLKDVTSFKRLAGGAPANVCSCVGKLEGNAVLLTKLGNDSFKDYIMDELKSANVNTNYIKTTNKANTGLAFVLLKDDGEREFSFYRNPSADMLYNIKDLPMEIFNKNDVFHFCSVSLNDSPNKKSP